MGDLEKCKCSILGANLAFRLEAMTSGHRWKDKDWYNIEKETKRVESFMLKNIKILIEMKNERCTQYNAKDFDIALRAVRDYNPIKPSNEQDSKVSYGIDKAYDISGDDYWLSMRDMGLE